METNKYNVGDLCLKANGIQREQKIIGLIKPRPDNIAKTAYYYGLKSTKDGDDTLALERKRLEAGYIFIETGCSEDTRIAWFEEEAVTVKANPFYCAEKQIRKEIYHE